VKRGGILHPQLLRLLAETGHTDLITVCDRGFPVPVGPERLDLALTDDIPTVLDVLKAILSEFQIDRVVAAEEMAAVSPGRLEQIRALGLRVELVPHTEFKSIARTARATVRTGETLPYANIILVSG
jgi:D-ribose pyranase